MSLLFAALLLPGAPEAAAHATGLTSSVLPAQTATAAPTDQCSRTERRRVLADEQRLVLTRLGRLTTLRDGADLAQLAARGYPLPPHGFTSLAGMGVTLQPADFLMNPLKPGNPDLLFYEPSPAAKDVTTPAEPDFPYRLRGWGYITWYDYTQHPAGFSPCLERRDWFVHERGVHTLDGGMDAKPPTEDVHGTAAGNDFFASPSAMRPGVPHPRWWDIHFWLGDREAAVSLLNPGQPIRGIDPRLGELFFYPPPLGVRNRETSADLRGSWTRVRLSCQPKRRPHRCTVSGRLKIANPGNFTAARSRINFYLSKDRKLGKRDRLIQKRRVARLNGGAARTLEFNRVLKRGVSGRYLIAKLDATNRVKEPNEKDNVVVSRRLRLTR